MAKVSLKTLKPLHEICKYLGIWPSFNADTTAKCNRHYTLGILSLSILFCNFLYVLNGRLERRTSLDNSVFVMILLSDIATSATNFVSIININFLKGDRLHRFLEEMTQLEAVFANVKNADCYEPKHFYLDLVVCHLIYLLYMIYNSWEWTRNFGWTISQYTFLRDLMFYHVCITVFLIKNCVHLIKQNVDAVNYILEHHQRHASNNNAKTSNATTFSISGSNCTLIGFSNGNAQQFRFEDIQDWDLDAIGRIHTRLVNIVSEFNDIFGWNLVVLQIQLIANLLTALNIALVHGDGTELLGVHLDYNLYVICFIWFTIPLSNMLTLISACDVTKREMNKMSAICYNLIMESNDAEYIKRVKDLALQGHVQRPVFTAAGFFTYDYALVFPTMSTIISYFIVLIQFRS